jgi:S1-C subfamily serine protease
MKSLSLSQLSLATTVAFITVLCYGCSLNQISGNVGVNLWSSTPVSVDPDRKLFTREKAIQTYLQGRDLASIEGVWVWADNQYEIVIFRNDRNASENAHRDYDFVGVITDSQNPDRDRREVKLLLKETASAAVYSGLYITETGRRHGTAFIMNNNNLIETTIPQQRILLLRMYPKTGQTTARVAGSGTGFFVSSEIVATNYHVVSDAREINVLVGESTIKAELVVHDRQNDLALLKIKEIDDKVAGATLKSTIKCLSVPAADDLKAGQTVFVLGFPLRGTLSSRLSVSQGIINSTIGLHDDPTLLQISAPIQPGNSGSPLLNDKGQVVGVVTSTLRKRGVVPQNVNFAVKVAYLRALLAMTPNTECEDSRLTGGQNLDAMRTQELLGRTVVGVETR